MIELTLNAHRVAPDLHRVMIEQVPRIAGWRGCASLEHIGHQIVAGLLAARRDEIDVTIRIGRRVLVSAIEAIVHRAVLFDPQRLADPRLVDEASLLVTRYLGV